MKAEKCTFGVTKRKFLGFMITKERIEPHPEKVEAILQMQPPRIVKDVQRLNGGITTLSRLIPRCSDKCKHLFWLLKATKGTVEWTEVCDKAFIEFKAMLA